MKICIIPNTLTSALGVIAQNLLKYWTDKEDQLAIVPFDQFKELKPNSFDIYFPIYYIDAQRLVEMGYEKCRIVTGIHSHYLWDGGRTTPNFDPEPPSSLIHNLKGFKGVNVVSKRLKNIFSPHLPVTHTRCGYNSEIFKAFNKYKERDRLQIGWVGNSHKDCKGYNDFIIPIIEQLPKSNFEFKPCDIKNHYIPHDLMASYYQSIDLVLVAAQGEGQPMPIIEAAAMGIPTLSTNVGIVPEILSPSFILKRDINTFVSRIKSLTEYQIEEEGRRLTNIAKFWTWESNIQTWVDFVKKNN